jgi:hypothetical protein
MADTATHLVDRVFPEVPVRQWVLSVPFPLRYRLAYDSSLVRDVAQIFVRTVFSSIRRRAGIPASNRKARCGAVGFIQRFSDALNLDPHFHIMVTDGAFSNDGEFLPLPSLGSSIVCQLFRRMLLLRLHKADRLSEGFMQNLLFWVHPGFSVYAGPRVEAAEIASLESQARYITRPVLAMDALRKLDGGSLVLETPPIPGRAQPRWSWIRSNGFNASRRISAIRDAIVKGSTEPIPTAAGFRPGPYMGKTATLRQ